MSLYCWGANSYGQLGLGYRSDEEITPKEIPLKDCDLRAENIVSIAGGAGHTLILDNQGKVYCCGWNAKGQLALSDDTLKFTQIEILKEFKVVQISCGWDFSAAVTECGKQFVWGNNGNTQLGLSKSITCTGIPSRLQVSQKLATGFKHVSCGLRHSAMITKDGGLLVAGTGAKGQLGLGDNFDDNNYLSITRVPDLSDVISVASGQHHTVVLIDNGTVLSWGENKFGQLGVDPNVANSFVPLEVFNNESLKTVYAGWTHSAALTDNGEVYMWGRNSYGQLGSQRDVPYKIEKVPSLSNVSQLSVGSEHNLAISEGKLLAWGWNEHGSCGTGDKKDVKVPTQILANSETQAKFIQGRIHSVERNIAEFCTIFAQYSRKIARVRDKGDELARTTLGIAESETINKSLAVGLENFADCVSLISDYGDLRVQALDAKVVGEFTKYEDICKQVKEEVKEIYCTRDREISKKRQLDRLRERNPRSRQQIIQAETELVKATAEVSKSIHSLEEKTNNFEKQKLHDIKSILLDFIAVEIGYHSKCLEILTRAFNDVQSINEEADLEEFKKSLRFPETGQQKYLGKNSLFRSTGSMGSLGNIFSSNQKKRTPGIPDLNKRSKSEETLDSLKNSVTDTEESDEDTVQDVTISSEDYVEEVEVGKKPSPIVVRKFKK